MLIQFTVGNFLSFHEKRTISFEAGSISELSQNVLHYEHYKLLCSAVLYGANSSGKSNLITAFLIMKQVIRESVKLNDTDELRYAPFLLSENINEPTYFEMVFLLGDIRYRYGFEYTKSKIINEWLFYKKGKAREKNYFIRIPEGIHVDKSFAEGINKEDQTNDNRLFISLVAQLGGRNSKEIMSWFDSFNVISGINEKSYSKFTLNSFMQNDNNSQLAKDFFDKLKLGFNKIYVDEYEVHGNFSKELPAPVRDDLSQIFNGTKVWVPFTTHNKYSKSGEVIGTVNFNLDNDESEGTKKLFKISGPIFDTLNTGSLLIIDELDAKMHPLITIEIINLFNNPLTNPHKAQLLFTTHDTNLLSSNLFRRDQIWFTEKDEKEQTDLYSLLEFKLPDNSTVRNDVNYEKNYIKGRFGAVPYIHNSE